MARKPANKENKQPSDSVAVKEVAPTENEVAIPNGTQRLGKGLWGIVGNKTRYGAVTQFSGLEYVRYEYRRIPDEFREVAFNNTYLDVIEITQDLPVAESVEVESAETQSSKPLTETVEGSDADSVSIPAIEDTESKG